MPISIKNAETEELARKLAALTGERLTEAIREALAERYERQKQVRVRMRPTLTQELNEIALRCANRPVISEMKDDQILGYDDSGIPSL